MKASRLVLIALFAVSACGFATPAPSIEIVDAGTVSSDAGHLTLICEPDQDPFTNSATGEIGCRDRAIPDAGNEPPDASTVESSDGGTGSPEYFFCDTADTTHLPNHGYRGCCNEQGFEHSNEVIPGMLIKRAQFPYVYYVGSDGKFHIFPTSDVLNSWYAPITAADGVPSRTDAAVCGEVREVSDEVFNSMLQGNNIHIRPGSFAIYIEEQSATKYFTTGGGVLRHMSDAVWSGFAAHFGVRDIPIHNWELPMYCIGADIVNSSEYDTSSEYTHANIEDDVVGTGCAASPNPANVEVIGASAAPPSGDLHPGDPDVAFDQFVIRANQPVMIVSISYTFFRIWSINGLANQEAGNHMLIGTRIHSDYLNLDILTRGKSIQFYGNGCNIDLVSEQFTSNCTGEGPLQDLDYQGGHALYQQFTTFVNVSEQATAADSYIPTVTGVRYKIHEDETVYTVSARHDGNIRRVSLP